MSSSRYTMASAAAPSAPSSTGAVAKDKDGKDLEEPHRLVSSRSSIQDKIAAFSTLSGKIS